MKTVLVNVVCPCGNDFETYRTLLKQGRGKYCSKQCMYKFRPPAKRTQYTKRSINAGWFKLGEKEWERGRNKVPVICGIYKITNPIGEVYIGSSRNIYRRWLRHREGRKNVPVHNSIKKYGWRSHTWEILSQLPSDINDSDLINQEQVYINLFTDGKYYMLNVLPAGHYLKTKISK